MKKRAKGEGTLYKTIQKQDRKQHRLAVECETCRNCKTRELCNNREGTKKFEKFRTCTDCLIYCDRFYCNIYFKAQATVNGKQKTLATGKKQKEVNSKKAENLVKIDSGKYINKNNITLSQQLRSTQERKLIDEEIGENTFKRNIESIKSIEKKCPTLAFKKLQDVTKDDILTVLRSHKNRSQSTIEKVYDIIHVSLEKAIKDKLIESDKNPIANIKRTSILSEKDRKIEPPFTIDETNKLIKYINENNDELVDTKAKIDSISMKNLIKLSFAFGTRCGELVAIDFNKHIDFKKKQIIVERTLTQDTKDNVIMGKLTKTGKKTKKKGDNDIRKVPFDSIYPEYEVEKILKEQIKIAQNIDGNKDNLLFCNKDGSYIDVKHITCIFKKICRHAGIKLDLKTGCHIHMARHTFVTRLIESKMDIYAIGKIVGTSRDVLEKTYAHILDDFVENEIEKSKQNREEQSLLYVEDNKQKNSNIIKFPKIKTS